MLASPPLLTPTDVATRLNVKYRVVLDLLAPGGALHHLRIELGHKTLRICPMELEQVIASGGVTVCK